MEGGKEANYWPGFVDALSNVVVTMVFVMVVFVIALLYFSQNKAKEMIAAAKREMTEQATKDPKPGPELAKRLAELQAENEALKKALSAAQAKAVTQGLQQSAIGGTVSPQAGANQKSDVKVAEENVKKGSAPSVAQIRGQQSAIEILFPGGTFELDKDSLGKLEAAFAQIAERARSTGIDLVGVAEVGPYSEGRRLSYYRNIALRNWLIDHGVPASKIRTRIAEKDTGKNTGLVQMAIPGE